MFGFIAAFLPWVVYWILVGNTSYLPAVAVAFAVAVVLQLVQLARRKPVGSLEIGGLVFFALSLVSAFFIDDAVIEQWLQPLSNGALFLIALVGVLIGRPFVRDAARSTVDAATAATDGFRYVTTAMTWMWVAVFGLMTASSIIPPVVEGSATIRDAASTLSIVCYWVVPFTLFGIAGAVSAVFPAWFDSATKRLDAAGAVDAAGAAGEGRGGHPAAGEGDHLDDLRTGDVHIDAPAESLYTDPFPVTVSGLEPGAGVQVRSQTRDLLGRLWRARAELQADADGAIDTATAAPLGGHGDWAAGAPGVLVSALRFAEAGQVPDLFVPPVEPLAVTIEVAPAGDDGSRVLARRTVLRRAAAEGVTVRELEVPAEAGEAASRRALFALPAGPVPAGGHPAVACFGGSEGGVDSLRLTATLLASAGFAALVTEWTDTAAPADSGAAADGEAVIARIPLERFGAALERLRADEAVDADRVAAFAISRGAEGLLAALAGGAATARAVIALSPSSVRWQAVGGDGELGEVGSWTAAGIEIPWLPVRTGELVPQLARNGWRLSKDAAHHRPTLLRLRPAYESGLAHGGRPRRQEAAIDAAAIDAPLLTAAGGGDAVWPSSTMAADLAAARRGSGASGSDVALTFPHAGHLLRLGLQPTDALWTGGIALGGTREAHAAAEAELWPAVLGFLRGTLS